MVFEHACVFLFYPQECQRIHPVSLPKSSAQMGLVGEPAFGGHFSDRGCLAGQRQEQPRPVQPVGPQVLARRETNRGVKQPAEMEEADTRGPGQLA